MLFAYKALDGAGFTQRGELEAQTEGDALRALYERGYTPVELSEKSARPGLETKGRQSIRQSDVVALIRELATLLGSGVGMSEALATLREATTHAGIRQTLSVMIAAVHAGDEFSVALNKTGLELPEYVGALARAGEATGALGGALARCAEQLEFEERMQGQAREALIYPAILILTGIGAILFIFSFVVPRFAGILRGRMDNLPWISEWVIRSGLFVSGHWPLLLVGTAAAVALAVLVLRRPGTRARIVAGLARFPVFSAWLASTELTRWVSTLAVLVQSRVPILLAIELSAGAVRLENNAARLRSVGDDVRLGKRLSAALEERRLLEGSSLTMVKVGEHSGELGGMLGHVAAYAVERHRQLQRRVVALIEPISILVIGLVLAIIMVGVVLAMASLTEIKL